MTWCARDHPSWHAHGGWEPSRGWTLCAHAATHTQLQCHIGRLGGVLTSNIHPQKNVAGVSNGMHARGCALCHQHNGCCLLHMLPQQCGASWSLGHLTVSGTDHDAGAAGTGETDGGNYSAAAGWSWTQHWHLTASALAAGHLRSRYHCHSHAERAKHPVAADAMLSCVSLSPHTAGCDTHGLRAAKTTELVNGILHSPRCPHWCDPVRNVPKHWANSQWSSLHVYSILPPH